MDAPAQEPWLERVMREAEQAGEFDDLAGSGRPIADLDHPYQPGWWAKRFIERQRLGDAAVSLATRVRAVLPRLLAAKDEGRVHAALEALNDEIAALNAELRDSDRLPTLDVERLLRERARRQL